MKPQSKRIIAASALGITLFGAGAYSGYFFGRSRSERIQTRPQLQEIALGASHSVSMSSSGSTHSDGYSATAFVMVGGELREILRSIVGEDYPGYYAYVLPTLNGFQLIIHHNRHVPRLTDQQHDELIEQIRARLSEETARWK